MFKPNNDDAWTNRNLELFVVDGKIVGESTTPPFDGYWQNPPPGIHTVHARAIDDKSQLTISETVTFSGMGLADLRTTSLGHPAMQVFGQAGKSYTLETSSDLKPWNQVTTVNGSTSGVRLVDPDAAASLASSRFYRIALK